MSIQTLELHAVNLDIHHQEGYRVNVVTWWIKSLRVMPVSLIKVPVQFPVALHPIQLLINE